MLGLLAVFDRISKSEIQRQLRLCLGSGLVLIGSNGFSSHRLKVTVIGT